MTEVNVEYDWRDLAELAKDRAIFAAAGREPHSAGTDVCAGTNTRDMQFEFATRTEARAALARIRAIGGVRAAFVSCDESAPTG